MPIRIRELAPGELPLLYPLIHQQNPWMNKPEFRRRLKAMLPHHYRAIGAFDGETLVGCSGFWISTRFWCGKQLDIDNFVVSDAAQGKGIGRAMTKWLEKKALDERCDLIVLDSYTDSVGTHMFYYKQGYTITGYHFTKLPGSNEPGALPFPKKKKR